jgi:hypothetical protein
LFGADGAVDVHEQHVHRAAVAAAVVVESGADGEVDDAVAVDVANRRDRAPELVAVVEDGSEAPGEVGELLFSGNGAARGHGGGVEVVGLAVAVAVEGIPGVAVAVGVGVLVSGGDAVAVVVRVEVVGDRVAVGIGPRIGSGVAVEVAVPVLFAVPQTVGVGVHGAVVDAEIEDVDGAAVVATVVVVAGADGEVEGAVAVEITQ